MLPCIAQASSCTLDATWPRFVANCNLMLCQSMVSWHALALPEQPVPAVDATEVCHIPQHNCHKPCICNIRFVFGLQPESMTEYG